MEKMVFPRVVTQLQTTWSVLSMSVVMSTIDKGAEMAVNACAESGVSPIGFAVTPQYASWNGVSTQPLRAIIQELASDFGDSTSEIFAEVELALCQQISLKVAQQHPALLPFTVIGYYANNHKIFSHHVMARSMKNAFYVCASDERFLEADPEFICAIESHVKEAENIEYAGDSVVKGDTVLQQAEVYS